MNTQDNFNRQLSSDSRLSEDQSENAKELERRFFHQKYKAGTVQKEKRTVDRNIRYFANPPRDKKFQLPDDLKFALSVACGSEPLPKLTPLPKIVSEGMLLFAPESETGGGEDDSGTVIKEKEVRIVDTPTLDKSGRPETAFSRSKLTNPRNSAANRTARPKTTEAAHRNGSGKARRTTSSTSRVCSAKTCAETSQTPNRKCGRIHDVSYNRACSPASSTSTTFSSNYRSRSAKRRQSKSGVGLRHRRKSRGYSVIPDDCEGNDSDYFESDSDIDQAHTQNDVIEEVRLYRRACRRLRVVTSRRVEEGLAKGEVDVGFSQLTREELKAICIAIVESVNVHRLELPGNDLPERCLGYLCQVLEENCHIKDLNLSDCRANREGVSSLIRCLQETNIVTSLDLSGIALNLEQVQLIGQYIQSSSALHRLCLSYCGIDEAGANVLAEASGSAICLSYLDLSWNQLRHKGALNFCLALKENETLRNLDLSWNGLGRDGCMGLETALVDNTCLQHLDVSSNRIGVVGLESLLRGLRANSTLLSVKMANNPLPTKSGTEVMNMLINTPTSALNVVDMSHIAVEDEFLTKLSELRQSRVIYVFHGHVMSRIKDINGMAGPKSLSSFDPILVLFEYMKLNNLRLIDLFKSLDTNGDKVISKTELRAVFLSLNMGLPAGTFDAMFRKMDTDHNNMIDMDEMKLVHRRVMRQARALKARAANSKDDEYGDVMHEFQTLVRKAVSNRRSAKPSSRGDLSRRNSPARPVSSKSMTSPRNETSLRVTSPFLGGPRQRRLTPSTLNVENLTSLHSPQGSRRESSVSAASQDSFEFK